MKHALQFAAIVVAFVFCCFGFLGTCSVNNDPAGYEDVAGK